MKSSISQEFGNTVIVLGAGATRGTSLASKGSGALPPLDSDFFTQVQRVKSNKHQPYIDEIIRYCHDEFGPGWNLTMEEFFNHIWHVRSFRRDPKVQIQGVIQTAKTGKKSQPKITKIDLFKQVLLGVLEESLHGNHSQDPVDNPCSIHAKLAENIEALDAVVTFNYDCVMDSALAACCDHFDPTQSYCAVVRGEKAIAYWGGEKASPIGGDWMKFLKLHGSINWRVEGGDVHLIRRPYTIQRGVRKFSIVPPVIDKGSEISKTYLSEIWEEAQNELATADSLCVFGYSLPAADAYANALFRSMHIPPSFGGQEETRDPLRCVVLADRNPEVRRKWMRLLHKQIGPSTRVLVFDTMEEAVGHLF